MGPIQTHLDEAKRLVADTAMPWPQKAVVHALLALAHIELARLRNTPDVAALADTVRQAVERSGFGPPPPPPLALPGAIQCPLCAGNGVIIDHGFPAPADDSPPAPEGSASGSGA